MKIFLQKLIVNYPYIIAVLLFVIGIFIILNKSDLIKKLIGINIMEGSIFIMFVAAGNIRGGAVPIVEPGNTQALYVNPLPSALILTGIVVGVSVSAFALALIIRIHKTYGTTDVKEIEKIRNQVETE